MIQTGRSTRTRFRDRVDAGRRLAEALGGYRDRSPIVVGLARGGLPVASEVARALDAPLDVLVVRKLGVPFQPELGMGAIAEGGARVLNPGIVQAARVSEAQLADVERRERRELVRRTTRYREGATPLDLEGRVVIVVDDGLATGGTARAAVAGVRNRGAAAVVLAVPVGAPETVEALEAQADEVICLVTPEPMYAVGAWYDDFQPTTDDDVVRLLRAARSSPGRVQATPITHPTTRPDDTQVPDPRARRQTMHARPGDEIVVDAVHTGEPSREGEILEVKTNNGIEHYRVRWDDGKETVFYPGSTTHTVRLGSHSR